MEPVRKLAPFEESLAAILLGAKEAVIGPMRPKLRECGITEPQWRVLRVINDRGPTDATGLAEVGLLHAPSVTRILKELELRCLIIRQPDPADRRRAVVELSSEGHALVEDISQHVAELLGCYAERFGEDRLAQLRADLHALTCSLRDISH